MRSQWVFKQCDAQKEVARKYWDHKTHRIERLLVNFAVDFHCVRLTLYHHQKRNEFELRAVLNLPTSTLVAQECDENLHAVIDLVADGLTCQIRRHKEKLRQDQLQRRRVARREQLRDTEPCLLQDVEAHRPESFVRLLLPYMNQVYDLARRELAIMEIENQFPKREWTPADLVDDVLLTGCERYDKRPHGLSIDTWLVCLLNERLEELRTSPEPVTLATLPVAIDESSSSDADLDDAAFWMRELLELDDDMSVDELLADEKNAELFEHLVTGDQRDHVNRVLRELPKFQRQALMLHDAYGFSLEEVTRALERDIEDVRADLVTGREKLRRTLATAC